ncbi:hypothetical protein PENSPDRAFT_690494 [Peniophora sp. CONT]|nr:hypothetical protein PENSPDRAFT_690494 [Peniophora sp. CONT]
MFNVGWAWWWVGAKTRWWLALELIAEVRRAPRSPAPPSTRPIYAYHVELLDLPRFEVLYDESAPSTSGGSARIAPNSPDALSMVLHSSGTSAFPKPIQMTNRNYIAWGTVPYYGELDICGTRLGIHTAPMFHAMGAITLVWAVCCGIELAVFKPASPPVVGHATAFLDDLVRSGSNWAMSVPALVEASPISPMNGRRIQKTFKC